MHSLQEVEMAKTDARTDDMEVGRDGFKGRRLEVEDTGVLILAKDCGMDVIFGSLGRASGCQLRHQRFIDVELYSLV